MQIITYAPVRLPFRMVEVHKGEARRLAEKDVRFHVTYHFARLLGKDTFFADCLARQPSIDRLVVLTAHGGGEQEWMYEDTPHSRHRVQDWVTAADSKNSALLIISCNEAGHDVKTRESPIMYPDGLYGGASKCRTRIYTPQAGRYTIGSVRSIVPRPARAQISF